MPLKSGSSNLYFHPDTFNKRQKRSSYLTSFSPRGPVNPSTPTFRNINLKETNLIVAWKLNQKWVQKSLF